MLITDRQKQRWLQLLVTLATCSSANLRSVWETVGKPGHNFSCSWIVFKALILLLVEYKQPLTDTASLLTVMPSFDFFRRWMPGFSQADV